MRVLRVYLDASVFGGCFDPPFQEDSLRILAAIRAGRVVALLSQLVADELAPARTAMAF